MNLNYFKSKMLYNTILKSNYVKIMLNYVKKYDHFQIKISLIEIRFRIRNLHLVSQLSTCIDFTTEDNFYQFIFVYCIF